jgi:hypothetical protein
MVDDDFRCRWKHELIERSPELSERRHGHNAQDGRVTELERVVGRLRLELEMAKNEDGQKSYP